MIIFYIPFLFANVIVDCEEALKKFSLESKNKMSDVDIDIARLRLIPFYYQNCKSYRMEWQEFAEQFDYYKHRDKGRGL